MRTFFGERQLSFECVTFESCMDFISDYSLPFNIILMDIDMPHMDGFSAAKKLRGLDELAVIIFITHMAQYAVRGYEVDALDFIVKPVLPFKLSVILEKALRRLPRGKTVTIVSERKTIVLSEQNILYVEGNNQYVIYHVRRQDGGYENFRVHASLKATEESLGQGFSRCCNSYIVNLSYVTKVGATEVQVDRDLLPVSRALRKQFLDALNRFFAGV